jgi:hypothetical protein
LFKAKSGIHANVFPCKYAVSVLFDQPASLVAQAFLVAQANLFREEFMKEPGVPHLR